MNTSLKRIWCLLAVIVAVLCLSVPISAADEQGARREILERVEAGREKIDLNQYELTVTELEALVEELETVGDWPWYVSGYSYEFYSSSRRVATLFVTYSCTMDERKAAEEEMNEILEQTVFPGMSQWQIALAVHDYLAAHTVYDESLEMQTVCDLLLRGSAVCEGYARTYQALMKQAGLDCILCRSDGMDHAWNMVRIQDEWYHVDVTWDDPVPDVSGRVLHEYFLLSDEQISDEDHEHYGWEVLQTADDSETMSGAFWEGISSQICYSSADTSFYRTREGTETVIVKRDEQTGSVAQLDRLDAGYVDVGAGSAWYEHYGLSLWNGTLYYGDMEHVYSIRTDGSERQTLYTHDADRERCFIQGVMVDDGVANLTYSDVDYDRTVDRVRISEEPQSHTHEYSEDVVSATCSEDGYIRYTCACGAYYTEPGRQMLGHRFEEAEETADGRQQRVCVVCGLAQVLEEQDSPKPIRIGQLLLLCLPAAAIIAAITIWRNNQRKRKRKRAAERIRQEMDPESLFP